MPTRRRGGKDVESSATAPSPVAASETLRLVEESVPPPPSRLSEHASSAAQASSTVSCWTQGATRGVSDPLLTREGAREFDALLPRLARPGESRGTGDGEPECPDTGERERAGGCCAPTSNRQGRDLHISRISPLTTRAVSSIYIRERTLGQFNR